MRPVEDHDLKTKKAKYIHSLIEEAKSGVAGASEDTPDFYSQWLQGDVKKHLAFMSLARRDGDMNGIRKQAELAQEAYVAKAASLYRALDDAVVRTERLIASNEYYHAELTDEELLALPEVPVDDLSVELGADESGEPVRLDFAETPHLVELCVFGTGGPRESLVDVVAGALGERCGVQFVAIGPSSKRCSDDASPLCIPRACSPYAKSASVDWLTAEMEQRKRLLALGMQTGPELFVFASDMDADSWLYDWDGLRPVAEEGRDLGVHLVATVDYLWHMKTAVEPPTIDGLVKTGLDDMVISIKEESIGDRGSLYRLLTPKEFDSWAEYCKQMDARKSYRSELQSIKDLGRQFARGFATFQELLDYGQLDSRARIELLLTILNRKKEHRK